jgi:hypothetical protein
MHTYEPSEPTNEHSYILEADEKPDLTGRIIRTIFILGVISIIFYAGFIVTVPTGLVKVASVATDYDTTLTEGTHFLPFWCDTIEYEACPQILEFTAECITKEGAKVSVGARFTWTYDYENAHKLVGQYGASMDDWTAPIVRDVGWNLKSLLSQFTVEEILDGREVLYGPFYCLCSEIMLIDHIIVSINFSPEIEARLEARRRGRIEAARERGVQEND